MNIFKQLQIFLKFTQTRKKQAKNHQAWWLIHFLAMFFSVNSHAEFSAEKSVNCSVYKEVTRNYLDFVYLETNKVVKLTGHINVKVLASKNAIGNKLDDYVYSQLQAYKGLLPNDKINVLQKKGSTQKVNVLLVLMDSNVVNAMLDPRFKGYFFKGKAEQEIKEKAEKIYMKDFIAYKRNFFDKSRNDVVLSIGLLNVHHKKVKSKEAKFEDVFNELMFRLFINTETDRASFISNVKNSQEINWTVFFRAFIKSIYSEEVQSGSNFLKIKEYLTENIIREIRSYNGVCNR